MKTIIITLIILLSTQLYGIQLPEVPETVKSEIRAQAAKDWPDSYTMQAAAYREQQAAWQQLAVIYIECKKQPDSQAHKDLIKMIDKARKDWPGNHIMALAQFNQEIESIRDLLK